MRSKHSSGDLHERRQDLTATSTENGAETGLGALSLPAGLLAFSEEVPTRGLRRSLRHVAESLERGATIAEVLERRHRLPATVAGLLEASRHSDRLSVAFERYLGCLRENLETRRQVRVSLGYVVFLVAAAVLVSTLYVYVMASPSFTEIFSGYEENLPFVTRWLIAFSGWLARIGFVVLGGVAVGAVALWLVLGWIRRGAIRQAILNWIPLIGSVLRYSALAQFCHLLSVLVEARLPLPQALRIAGEGSDSVRLQRASERMARAVEGGESAYDAAVATHGMPVLLASLFRWSGREDVLPEALHATGDMYAARSKAQASLVVVIFEPLFILFVAVMTVVVAFAILMPLIRYISNPF